MSSGASAINDLPSLCVLMEKASNEKKEEATVALEVVVPPYDKAKASGNDADMAFFTCTQVGGLCARLREMTKLGDATDDIKLVLG